MKRKIKLRDLTKEQWDNYTNKCRFACNGCIFLYTCCQNSKNERSWFNNKDLYSNKFLDQEIEIETTDILDEAEKRYLRAVIRPYRNKVIYIRKYFYALSDVYSIEIYMKSVEGIFNTEYLRLPLFKNEMYKGMEDNKKYTLKELDL